MGGWFIYEFLAQTEEKCQFWAGKVRLCAIVASLILTLRTSRRKTNFYIKINKKRRKF